MVFFFKAPNRESLPRRRGPAKVLGVDETGATESFQSQTFKVARYCVRRRVKDSEEPEGEGPALTMPRGHGMGSMGGDMGSTP